MYTQSEIRERSIKELADDRSGRLDEFKKDLQFLSFTEVAKLSHILLEKVEDAFMGNREIEALDCLEKIKICVKEQRLSVIYSSI